jgi:haloacetate dehalogenase
MKMLEGFEDFDIQVNSEVKIHGIKSGSGPALLLIHGFPQTHHMWHLVAPQLASSYTTILIDLRGYGKSSKPPSSATDNHKAYAKSSMALDCLAVMSHFGFETFSVLAHDRGARVAHKLCVDHPFSVSKVMLLDICPTLTMYENTTQEFATYYWHWFWLIQKTPFPETLILNNEKVFREMFLGEKEHDPEAMKEFARQLTANDTVHAMCEDYRAGSTIDLVEARKDREEGRKIKCPVRVLWGKKAVIEKCFDALKDWQVVSDGVVDGEAVDSGHYVAEDVPEVLLKHCKEFFV